MKKSLLLFMALFATALNLSAKNATWDFSRKTNFRVYPANFAAQWQQDEGYSKLVKTPDIKRELNVYTWVTIPENTGTMKIRINYRIQSQDKATGTLLLRFKTKDGEQEVKRFKLEQSKEWENFETIIDLFPDAKTCQFTLGINGANAELLLRQIEVRWGVDRVTVSPADETLSAKKTSQWKTPILEDFYQAASGLPAKVQTSARIACDEKNLYIGFIADEPHMEKLKTSVKERDETVWTDDCVELFIFDREQDKGWQFAVNAAGTMFDAELKQSQAGDPYKAHKQWNGRWTGKVWRSSNSWEAVLTIPWADLGFQGIPQRPLYLNLARERKVEPEITQWNAFVGNLHDVMNYAELKLAPAGGTLTRFRKLESIGYVPERKNPQYGALLSAQPGGYIVGAWPHGAYISDYPETVREKYNAEEAGAWTDKFIEARGKAHMFGIPMPWSVVHLGMETLKRYGQDYGVRSPYVVFGSNIHNRAMTKNKTLFYGDKFQADPASDEYIESTLEVIDKLSKKAENPDYRNLIAFIHGIDEPTNNIGNIYSFSRNPGCSEALARVEQTIRGETGFNKYGIQNIFGSKPSPDSPFQRIAFWRYWNKRFEKYLNFTSAKIRKQLPGLPYLAVNRNSCSGVCPLDIALVSPDSEWIGCDPYPTSAKAFYGMGRALYHTGFSVKLLTDLSPKSRVCVMPQAFIYHGGRPKPGDIREWAAQGLKNGAEIFFWYTMGPALLTMPEAYNEMLNVNRQIAEMNKLELPKATRTAILYSDYDRWGLDDAAAHAAYSTYAILGEHLKSWFRFISPTGLANGLHKLADYKLLYIPRMRYTDPTLTAELVAFMKDGGTIVTFDPDFLKFNIDGTTPPERKMIPSLVPRRTNDAALLFKGRKLPLSKVLHLELPENGTVYAYDFQNLPESVNVMATYTDKKPTMVEIPVGKGRLIYSAVMPFGSSDIVLNPGSWVEFFAEAAKSAGEKTGLPIWDFELVEQPGGRIELAPPGI